VDFGDTAQPAIGQLLMTSSDPVYGPWMPRGGNRLLASWEVINIKDARPKLAVETKNTENDDAEAVELGVSEEAVSPGVFALLVSDCLELVRFRYAADGASNDWVHLRNLPMSWLRN